MFQSFFNGLSGMFSFSQGLDNVSNNVANMNTPGFRGSDTFLRNVGGTEGFGTTAVGTNVRTTSGEVRQTGNAADLALTGSGFFVLRNDSGELFYTRAGQFDFNEDGVLIDRVTEMTVLGISDSNNLEVVDISEDRILPPEATQTVSFAGNLSTGDASHTIADVTIFDANGGSHILTVTFNNPDDSENTWQVEIADATGAVLTSTDTPPTIQFGTTGTPLVNLNQFDVDFDFDGLQQSVNFFFGEPGSFSSTTQNNTTPVGDTTPNDNSTLGVSEVDGHAVLGLSTIEFDEDGVVKLTYSNGDTADGQQVAVASFTDESGLEQFSGSLYRAQSGMSIEYGRANNMGLGAIQGGSIELSNIDLTQEFADILIIQRGYQASSQIMSVSNELIEQLYNSTRG